jgi:hypothetical protein
MEESMTISEVDDDEMESKWGAEAKTNARSIKGGAEDQELIGG